MIEIVIEFTNDRPLYHQIYEKIKEDILLGKTKAYEKLPSKRRLSTHLEVSINTIDAAYQQLIAEGYVESKPRKGLFVNKLEKQNPFGTTIFKKNNEAKDKKLEINFSQGDVDVEAFPYKAWRKCVNAVLDSKESFQLGHSLGEYELREQIAEYLFRSRGVKCSIDQIVIGSGTQYLLLLILMLFDPGTAIAVENPGYYRANLIFKQAGMNVVPIPVKEHGVDVSEILSKEVQLVYCTPSHQFPLGMIMPIHQRQRLIQWANERDGYIIEDDYDGEFRYDGRPIPAMQGLDPFGRVIYLGTFSKSLVPSLRVNYMVLPEGLIRKFNTDLFYMKQSVSKIHQETIAYFIKEGYWEKHLNKMRTLYRRKRELLIEMLKNRFGETIEIKGEKSGLHIVVELNETSYCEEELIRLAEDAGVKVYGASVFYTGKAPKKPQILLGYGGLSQEEVVKGIDRLADAWNLYNTNNI